MPATALVTSEQYLAPPDQFDQHGNRIQDELIGGEIVRMAFPSRTHDRIKNHICRIPTKSLEENRDLGLEANVEMGTQVSELDTFAPDVSVTRVSPFSEEDRIPPGPPEIAIEIVCPSDTASHLKATVDAYLANGSRSVWVIFPEFQSVILPRPGSTYELRPDQSIHDPLLPGFSTPVSSFCDLIS
jgi:Uma2 family endonuclease